MSPAPSGASGNFSVLYTINSDESEGDKDEKRSPYLLKYLITSTLPEDFVNKFEPADVLYWRTGHDRAEETSFMRIIVSIGSGTGLASLVWERLVQPFLSFNGVLSEDYTLHFTTSENTVTEVTRDIILTSANQGIAQSIILLSGDGGIVDMVNALLSAERTETFMKPSVSLLPLGTGNAMANSTGILSDNTLGLRTMSSGSTKEVSLFRATFSPGARLLVKEGKEEIHLQITPDGNPISHAAVVCSWGLHASLVADSDTAAYRKFGRERFQMAAKEALFPSDGSVAHAYKGKVSIIRAGKEDTEWEVLGGKEHGYVLASLVSNLEAGFTISPASKPLDGKLRLVYFSHMSGQDAMGIMTEAFKGGKHVENEKITYEEILGLRIEFEEEDARWRRVCVDGKIVRVEKGGWVEVKSGVDGVLDLVVKE